MYDLVNCSTFLKSADQSDYKRRMDLIEQILKSEVYDTGKIINDDVYREKQRAKMISRLTPFDTSILEQPGITFRYRAPFPHFDLFKQITSNYFTFDKQFLYYYQWYANS